MKNKEWKREDNLTPFTSTRQPANRGRKPSHLKKWIKDNGVGTQDIRLLLGGILAKARSVDDLKKILLDPKTPPIVLFPVKCLINEFGKNKIDTMKWLLEYGYGMPKQEIDSKTELDVTSLSREERDELKQRLLEKLRNEQDNTN